RLADSPVSLSVLKGSSPPTGESTCWDRPVPGSRARSQLRVGETFDPLTVLVAVAGRMVILFLPAVVGRKPHGPRCPAARVRRGHLPGLRVVHQRGRMARRALACGRGGGGHGLRRRRDCTPGAPWHTPRGHLPQP